MARSGGLFGRVFGGDDFVCLQLEGGSSKDFPTDSEGTFTDMADLTRVRRGFSLLLGEELFLDSCV